jgi:hypothetical protein
MKRLVEAWGGYFVRADVIHSGGPVRVETDPVGFLADLSDPDEPEISQEVSEPPC